MSDLSSFINISANTIAGNTISTPAGNVSGNNVLTSGVVSATGNVRGGNLNTAGNVTGNFFIGDGSQLTNLPAGDYSNANVEAYLPTSNTIININSNIANTDSNVANLTNSLANTNSNVANTNSNVANISNSVASLSGNVYANANVAAYLPTYTGNLAAGNVVVTASHGNLVFGDATATGSPGLSSTTSLTVTANRQGTAQVFVFTNEGNLSVPGNIGTGNVTANYFIGDGSQLTNLPVSDYSNANVANYLPTYSGNIGTGNITFTDNTVYSGTAITLPTTTTGTLNKFSWNFRDLSIGSDTVSLEWNSLTTTFGEFSIATDSNTTPYYFTFDGPGQTLGAIPSSGVTGGGKLTFGTAANSGAGNVDAIELTSSTSNVYVRANNNSWLFDNTGNLTIPNAILAQGVSSPSPVIRGFEFVGSLTGNVSTTGNVFAGNVSATGNITGNFFIGNGSGLTDIAIPSYGNSIAIGPGAGATSQDVNTVAIGANAAANAQGANSVAVGAGSGQTTQGLNAVAVGNAAGQSGQGANTVAVGYNAGLTSQGIRGVAVGYSAASSLQGIAAVAIGPFAGNSNQSNYSVAVGYTAGYTGQGQNGVAIGQNAGYTNQGPNAVAVGYFSGYSNQSANAISIGFGAGQYTQGARSIAIGLSAAANVQGTDSIAIGYLAGVSVQANNTIVLNASGSAFDAATANGFYVNPIRNDSSAFTTGNSVNYNWATNELSYTNTISLGGNVSGSNLVTAGLITATGNAIAGNIRTAGLITATGNVTSGNVLTSGQVSATGNVTSGNVRTAGSISATGNVTAGNVYSNAITLTNTDDFAQVVFSNDGGATNNGQIKVDGGTNMVVSSASNFYVKRAGSDRIAVTDTTADFMASTNVRIQSNKVGTTNTWTFDNAGNLTIPNSILAQGPISSPSPVISGFEFIGELSGNVSTTGSVVSGKVYVGPSTSANITRFPNALAVVSSTTANIQQNELGPTGLIAEATGNPANTTYRGVGLYGVGYTSGAASADGVSGEAHVSDAADTGTATAVRGYADSTHSGTNIGLYSSAIGGDINYALYMKHGNIFSFDPQAWTVVANTANALTIGSATSANLLVVNTAANVIDMSSTLSVAGNVYGNNLTTKATGSWTLSSGVNTVSITVPANGTYSMWVNGNIPNGICVWNATVTVTNTNVPVIGSQYAWYYAAGNALVLTSIPAQIIGTNGVIGNATGSGTTNNVFEFGITNNSGSSQVVNWGWVTLS